jgi:hypothetical protein
MKTSRRVAAVAAVFLVACAPLQPAPPVQVNLKGEIAAFLEQYLAAISSRDAEKIRSTYVTDGRFVWIEDGKVRYRQVDEVLASLAAFPVGSPIRTEFTDITAVPVGDSAAHAWATFKTTIGEGSHAFSFGGAISFALERTGNSWKIVGGHTSSPSRR